MTNSRHFLEHICLKADSESPLSHDEFVYLLNLEDRQDIRRVCRLARRLRLRHFGNKIYLYGFIYISTYCRNNCRFCFYRSANANSRRYRKSKPEILSAAASLSRSGVHLIDLTMGEDPALLEDEGAGPDGLPDLVAAVRQSTGLPVMVSPGAISETLLDRLKSAGADWYACYQETHSLDLFRRLRPGQSFQMRWDMKKKARGCGLLIEEGLLCGVGETADYIARSIHDIKALNADQIRVMNFVPQPGTPMETQRPLPPDKDMLTLAVLRIAFPDKLIPASLDIDGIAGLRRRLNCGANVITSIIPPGEGLCGVAQHALDIESGRRTAKAVSDILDSCGLSPATRDDYLDWIRFRQTKTLQEKRHSECAR
jgi:methylornithine synthase